MQNDRSLSPITAIGCPFASMRPVMGWKTICFGSEDPSVLRILVVGAFVFGLGLCFYGVFVGDFIPSNTWHSIGYYSSVALATVLTLWVYRAHFTGALKSPERRRWVRILSFLALPFFFFGYCYLCLMYALPDLGTRWLGANAVRTENVTVHYREGRGHTFGSRLNRRFCRYYIQGPGMDHAFLSRICSATPIPGNSLSPSALDLKGRKSWLGFHVSDFVRHPVEQQQHAPSVAAAQPTSRAAPSSSVTGTIEAEKTGSNSYRLHLTGAVFNDADAGRALLRPKAAELCGSETYRFERSSFSWKRRMPRGGEPGTPIVELTQDVHCGDTVVPAAQSLPDNE